MDDGPSTLSCSSESRRQWIVLQQRRGFEARADDTYRKNYLQHVWNWRFAVVHVKAIVVQTEDVLAFVGPSVLQGMQLWRLLQKH